MVTVPVARWLQNNRGTIRNIGGRFREELEFVPKVILAAGLGFEQSMLSIQSINYTGATPAPVSANRTFYNWAPEMSLSWKPAEGYRHWVRASTGYGIPQFGNLLRDPITGQPGTNFDLKPQKNLNTEIGTESRLHQGSYGPTRRVLDLLQERDHHPDHLGREYRLCQCGFIRVSGH